MLSVERKDDSVEARMTKNNGKDSVESREQDEPKKDEKHRERETMVYGEDEVRDGMHVNRSW